MSNKETTTNDPVKPRDGLDNTGTQGYDSLSDDAFTGSSKKPLENPNDSESGTGSRSTDFHNENDQKKV